MELTGGILSSISLILEIFCFVNKFTSTNNINFSNQFIRQCLFNNIVIFIYVHYFLYSKFFLVCLWQFLFLVTFSKNFFTISFLDICPWHSIGCLTPIRPCRMKTPSSIRFSISPSVSLSLNFLRTGSLGFSQILDGDSWP